jgi:hemolysin activation/secretion protein
MRAFLVVILVVAGLAFYQVWLHPADTKGKMMTEDRGQAKERAQSLGRVGEQTEARQSGNESALGWVKKVEVADNCFLMTTLDNEKLTVHLGPSTTLALNGREITLADLEQVRS